MRKNKIECFLFCNAKVAGETIINEVNEVNKFF